MYALLKKEVKDINDRLEADGAEMFAEGSGKESASASSRRQSVVQLKMLLDNSIAASLATLVAVPALVLALYTSTEQDGLLLWAGLVMGLSLLRYAVMGRIRRVSHFGEKVNLYHNVLLVWNGITGLAWGFSAYLLFPESSLFHQLLVVLVIAGVIALSVSFYVIRTTAVAVFAVSAISPLILRFLTEDMQFAHELAALSGLYLAIILLVSVRLNRLAMASVRLDVIKSDLVDHLEQARVEAESVNERLRQEVESRREAEHRLRYERDFIAGVLDTESALVVVLDDKGRVVRFNRASEAVSGYSAHELTGTIMWDRLLESGQKEKFKSEFNLVMSGRFPIGTEMKWIGKGGSDRILQMSVTAILGKDGKATHVVLSGTDITERRRTEIALARTQEDFQLLVDGVTSYAIYMLDANGVISTWNSGAERITGYSSSEAIGSHYTKYLSCRDKRTWKPSIELKLAASEGRYEKEEWYLRKDGSRFWATITINPLRSHGGHVFGYSVIIGDLTERKTNEDTIRALATITEQLNSSLDLDLLLGSLVKESLDLVGAESGAAGVVEEGGISDIHVCREGMPAVGQHEFPLESGAIPSLVLESGHWFMSNSAGTDSRVPDPVRRNYSLKTVLSVPIIDISGESIGFIQVHNKKAEEGFTKEDISKLMSVSNSASLAIQNARSYRAVKRAEALLNDENVILEAVARRDSLHDVFNTIAAVVEKYCNGIKAEIFIDEHYRRQTGGIVEICGSGYGLPESILRQGAGTRGLGEADRVDDCEFSDVTRQSVWCGGQSPEGHFRNPVKIMLCSIGGETHGPVGQMALVSEGGGVFTEEDVHVINKMKNLAAMAIDKRRSEFDLLLRDRAIQSSVNAIVILEDDEERHLIRYVNHAAESLIGVDGQVIVGTDFQDLLEGVFAEGVDEIWETLDGTNESYHILVGATQTSPRYVEIYLAPVARTDNESSYSIAVMNEITQRIETEGALKESEHMLRAMASNMPGMVFQLQRDALSRMEFTYVSDDAVRFCGISASQLITDPDALFRLIDHRDNENFVSNMEESARTLAVWNWEGRIDLPEAGVRWIELSASPRQFEDKIIWDGIIFDVTSRKSAELDLASSREQLRALSGHLQQVREEEKAGLARELHDQLGSMLTTLKIDASHIRKHLAEPSPAIEDRLDTVTRVIDDAIRITRRISTDLRPPILDDMGLLPTIEWQLSDFRKRTGIEVELNAEGDSDVLNKDQTITLFRILQESLTNISRYAQASTVRVNIAISDTVISMDIIDDGIGFDLDEQRRKRVSFGLYGMQERAQAIGGTFEVRSSLEEGTWIRLRVPFRLSGNAVGSEVK